MGHRRGKSRDQAVLFPVLLDELVEEDSMVRVIDAWVSALDLRALGFGKAEAGRLGRPPYDLADLLKLYLCGYLNGLRSDGAAKTERRTSIWNLKQQILRNARLLLRGLKGARAELRLAVMAYNLKRVVHMSGSQNLAQAMRA